MQGEIARAEELLGALGEKVDLAARLIALVNEVLLRSKFDNLSSW